MSLKISIYLHTKKCI